VTMDSPNKYTVRENINKFKIPDPPSLRGAASNEVRDRRGNPETSRIYRLKLDCFAHKKKAILLRWFALAMTINQGFRTSLFIPLLYFINFKNIFGELIYGGKIVKMFNLRGGFAI